MKLLLLDLLFLLLACFSHQSKYANHARSKSLTGSTDTRPESVMDIVDKVRKLSLDSAANGHCETEAAQVRSSLDWASLPVDLLMDTLRHSRIYTGLHPSADFEQTVLLLENRSFMECCWTIFDGNAFRLWTYHGDYELLARYIIFVEKIWLVERNWQLDRLVLLAMRLEILSVALCTTDLPPSARQLFVRVVELRREIAEMLPPDSPLSFALTNASFGAFETRLEAFNELAEVMGLQSRVEAKAACWLSFDVLHELANSRVSEEDWTLYMLEWHGLVKGSACDLADFHKRKDKHLPLSIKRLGDLDEDAKNGLKTPMAVDLAMIQSADQHEKETVRSVYPFALFLMNITELNGKATLASKLAFASPNPMQLLFAPQNEFPSDERMHLTFGCENDSALMQQLMDFALEYPELFRSDECCSIELFDKEEGQAVAMENVLLGLFKTLYHAKILFKSDLQIRWSPDADDELMEALGMFVAKLIRTTATTEWNGVFPLATLKELLSVYLIGRDLYTAAQWSKLARRHFMAGPYLVVRPASLLMPAQVQHLDIFGWLCMSVDLYWEQINRTTRKFMRGFGRLFELKLISVESLDQFLKSISS